MRDRVIERTNEVIKKYFDGNYSGHIRLSKDGFGFRTDCTLHLDSGITLESDGMAADAYASADQALLSVEKRLRRYKSRLKDRSARKAYADANVEARVEPFIADMAAAYAWADLVVCRAGALTLAELCAVGVGSVLVPFPQAVDDHQTRNAEYLVERGAAVLLPQTEQLAARLQQALADLSADPGKRLAMAQAARGLARPDAAQRVAEAVLAAISNEVSR